MLTVTIALVGVIVTTTGITIVIVAEPVVCPSAMDTALIVTIAGLGAVSGAVYRPLEETVPQLAPEQPDPTTLQSTPVIVVPVTFAVNCSVRPIGTCAEAGERLTSIGATIVIVARLDFVGSATEVAFTKTMAGFGTMEGAV